MEDKIRSNDISEESDANGAAMPGGLPDDALGQVSGGQSGQVSGAPPRPVTPVTTPIPGPRH